MHEVHAVHGARPTVTHAVPGNLVPPGAGDRRGQRTHPATGDVEHSDLDTLRRGALDSEGDPRAGAERVRRRTVELDVVHLLLAFLAQGLAHVGRHHRGLDADI